MHASDLPTVYDPHAVEAKWYQFWDDGGYFHADVNSPKRERFCITIPPPNVTGSLHMGHALQHALHDLLARWQRMMGKETLILPGTDHAGIPTQMKVEQQLAAEGKSRRDLGRERFLRRMWQWREKYGGTILKQLRALGCSYDWRRERFTLDDAYYRAVLTAFVHFYRRGWIYRGERVVNWCPACNTTVSDLEVEHREVHGKLWHIRYPSVDGAAAVVVATTRPETMLGDTAIAVHPSDERYRGLHGKEFILPLINRRLPLIADAALVDPEFGTGAVKITPAHDPNDFDAGQRNHLPSVTVIGKDARMTPAAGAYAGLDRYQARDAVLRDLEAQGLLVQTEDYDYSIGHHDKCGAAIEPLLSEQWFLAMRELAAMAKKSLARGEVSYIPERFRGYTLEWLDNLRDWNISRQIWWGHRLPVWFCGDCDELTVQVETPSACSACGSVRIEQAPDVLDTWFSSALWPFATLGWPEAPPEMERFYPTDLLITGRDILYLWVVRMVMTSLEFTGQVPFYRVLVHPTILNWEGRRMSKSLGTGVDPMELISAYGADATRFGLIVQCSSGQDVRFTEERIEMSRNFANKIWNAARLVRMHLDDAAYERAREAWPDAAQLAAAGALADRWILSRMEAATAAVTQALEEYRVDEAARALYDFFWGELCDWYLEIAKPALRSDDLKTKELTQDVLICAFDRTLRLLHPFMPFITEELWQALPHQGDSIMTAPWPTATQQRRDQDRAERDMWNMSFLTAVVTAVRRIRMDHRIEPSAAVDVKIVPWLWPHPDVTAALEATRGIITYLARARSIELTDDTPGANWVTAPATWGESTLRVYVLSALSVEDLKKEQERLEKQLQKFESDAQRLLARYNNPDFRRRAPAPAQVDTQTKAFWAQQQAAIVRRRIEAIEGQIKDLE
jgi:valyl-tRNA synthetase